MIKLGIIIPTLNRKDLLSLLLKSLGGQKEEFNHLLVIDNGKQNIKLEFGELIENEKNLGVASSWNQGMRRMFDELECTHVLILNDDIVLHKKQIQYIINTIDENSDKWLISAIAWHSFVLYKDCWENLKYEEGKVFDESFYPAYGEDLDLAYRIGLLFPDGSKIATKKAMKPKIVRTSQTIEKDPSLKNKKQRVKYYSYKWGGTFGNEIYKKPFNGVKKQCYVVVGMHRSGTSALAGSLQNIGIPFKKTKLTKTKANPKGYFENWDLVEVNNGILKEFKSTWDSVKFSMDQLKSHPNYWFFVRDVKHIVIDIAKLDKNFGIKDPRISLLLPIYEEVFKSLNIDPRYIVIKRDINSTIKSLKSVSVPNNWNQKKGKSVTLKYWEFLEKFLENKEHLTIKYEELIEKPVRMIRKILKKWPSVTLNNKKIKELNAFIAPKLKRF